MDRGLSDEFKSANSLLRNSQQVINKVYKSKHKMKSSKLASPKQSLGLSNEKLIHKMISRSKPDKMSSLTSHSNKVIASDTLESKKSTEFQTVESPRDTRTDQLESYSEKQDKIMELEVELNKMYGENQHLKSENTSLRSILKDYETLKTNESSMLDRIETLESQVYHYQSLESEFHDYKLNLESKLTNLETLNKSLQKDLNRAKNDSEMELSHLETKIRLLKEALNKRNDDIREIETSNEELIEVLAKCDEKLVKLDEGNISFNPHKLT
jgi:DNA repair exonuclease SbcCD ATPase subunit